LLPATQSRSKLPNRVLRPRKSSYLDPLTYVGALLRRKNRKANLLQSPLDKNLPLARPGPLPRGFRKPPLCIGRSSSRLLSPPLRYSKDQLSPHLPLQSLRKHRNFKAWPDLFTGDNICPMLIVFRADCYACLKHSSLFKVKILKTVK
jgi:hypothetical protein